MQPIFQGGQLRRGLLREAVKHPPAIATLEDVPSGIARFEDIMMAYNGFGGVPPVRRELEKGFLETLPGETR